MLLSIIVHSIKSITRKPQSVQFGWCWTYDRKLSSGLLDAMRLPRIADCFPNGGSRWKKTININTSPRHSIEWQKDKLVKRSLIKHYVYLECRLVGRSNFLVRTMNALHCFLLFSDLKTWWREDTSLLGWFAEHILRILFVHRKKALAVSALGVWGEHFDWPWLRPEHRESGAAIGRSRSTTAPPQAPLRPPNCCSLSA